MTSEAVCKALRDCRYTIVPIEVAADGAWIDDVRAIDVAFSPCTENLVKMALVQGLLNWSACPTLGPESFASAIAMNKPMAKRIWETYKPPTPRWQLIDKDGPWELRDEFTLSFGYQTVR